MDPVTLSLLLAGIGGGLGILGGSISYRQQKKLLKSQQNFAERMASTAHQREVEDLRKAGLNPILSSHSSGSQVSSPSAPSVAQMDIAGAAMDAVKTGLQSQVTESQLETDKTARSLNTANANKADADARLARSQAILNETNPRVIAKSLAEKFGVNENSIVNLLRKGASHVAGGTTNPVSPLKHSASGSGRYESVYEKWKRTQSFDAKAKDWFHDRVSKSYEDEDTRLRHGAYGKNDRVYKYDYDHKTGKITNFRRVH